MSLEAFDGYARIARAEVLTIRNSEYILAAQAQGASTLRILRRRIVPMCLTSVIIRLALDMAGINLTAASLGFLGLGAQPLSPEWGAMISTGRQLLLDQWWVPTVPGITMLVVSLGFCLLDDGLRDALDPKNTESRALCSSFRTCASLSTPIVGPVEAVRGVSFDLGRERLGIVGESGSGKSQTGRALLRLSEGNGQVAADRMVFDGINLMTANERSMRAIRGARISMIMQDPRYSLNPVVKVGDQMAKAYLVHSKATKREARERAIRMLQTVQIREPEKVFDMYPYQVLGGIGLILISHDLDLVASFFDRVIVMYAGQVMEVIEVGNLNAARHPCTRSLLNCVPELDRPQDMLSVLQRDPA